MPLPILVPIPAYYAQAEPPAETKKSGATLAQKDKRLQELVPPREQTGGSIKNITTWVKNAADLTVDTSITGMPFAKDYFIFGKVPAGDLMEAYSTLYRLRWVAYTSGKPHYELTMAKDQIDTLYAATDEFQKQRFAAQQRSGERVR